MNAPVTAKNKKPAGKPETKQPKAAAQATNVLIVGVGGQGVIMVSKVLALLCQLQGYKVKQSEVHGMAKRGGGVFSHVRFGPQVWSPTIPQGETDVLIALEWAEGMRWLSHLKPETGTFISDTQKIVPPFACLDRVRGAVPGYSKETPGEIIGKVNKGFAVDAKGMAQALGNARAANTILLGVLSAALDFPVEDWLSVIAQFVPPKTIDINREAFLAGRSWVGEATIPVMETALEAMPPIRPMVSEIEIVEAWCKGCDICVKMCPERCLALNAAQIVEVTDRQACTGCRMCEWLCPDFAIAIHKHPVDENRNEA